MEIKGKCRELIAQEMIAKFIATNDLEGGVNIAAITSLCVTEKGPPDILLIGDFLMVKTKRNINADSRLGFACADRKLRFLSGKADFIEWQTKGEYKEELDMSSFIRYNAYTGVRAAGIIRACTCTEVTPYSYAKYADDLLRARIRKNRASQKGISLHKNVRNKFLSVGAVKALAVRDVDGYPLVFPVVSLVSVDEGILSLRLPKGSSGSLEGFADAPFAICVLTMDAISYQLKGRIASTSQKGCSLTVTEAYSSSPPLLGMKLTEEKQSVLTGETAN